MEKEFDVRGKALVMQGRQISNATSAQGPAVVLSMDAEGNIIDPSKATLGCIAIVEWASSDVSKIIGTCAAVVAERGGMMCHCAANLRKAKKPGVFNVRSATTAIQDGDLVIVDGARVVAIRVTG